VEVSCGRAGMGLVEVPEGCLRGLLGWGCDAKLLRARLAYLLIYTRVYLAYLAYLHTCVSCVSAGSCVCLATHVCISVALDSLLAV